jgi:hypothetical protein
MILEEAGLTLHEDFSLWEFDFAMSLALELPALALKPRLPHPLQLFEVRPGVGLLNLTVLHFGADNVVPIPCAEVICAIHVMPDQQLAPVPPKMALYALQLGASRREFLDSRYATDRLPFLKDPLQVVIDRDRSAVEVADAAGNPIFHAALARVDASFEQDLFYSQTFAGRDGELYHGGNFFEGSRIEQQKRDGCEVRLFEHPFFHGIDVAAVGPNDVYVQMRNEPGTRGREYYFWLSPLA